MAPRDATRKEEVMTDWPDSSLSGVSHSGNPNPEGAEPRKRRTKHEEQPPSGAVSPLERGAGIEGEIAASPSPERGLTGERGVE